MRKAPFLSKSKYLAGLQCPMLLWMHYHAKEKFPPTDPETQAIFDQGHAVTKVAQELFPAGGIEIPGSDDYDEIVRKTQAALSLKKPIFEGGFRYKDTYARPDVLKPNKDGSWDLYEVKSSTKVKDCHYPDVAFQKYCYEGAGIKIRRSYLTHINNQYVRNGAIDPVALLTHEDITEVVAAEVGNVESQVNRMLKILEQESCPKVAIGLHCDDPYGCSLKPLCWEFLPEHSVLTFDHIFRKRAFALIQEGFVEIKDVPGTYTLTARQRIQQQCNQGGKTHIDKSGIQGFLGQLKFPIHFLDFETVGGAIPQSNSSRPYQQVPFQYSLHILPGWGKLAAHHAFLAAGRDDPRPELLSRLESLIGRNGSILSYNMTFELGCLRKAVEAHPSFRKWFEGIESRFLDLIEPFRRFDYYDPKQIGKTSIKNVFPALTGGTYEGLGIADGKAASREYARVTFSDDVSTEESARIRKDLEIYCSLDTQAMIDVLGVLKSTADNGR